MMPFPPKIITTIFSHASTGEMKSNDPVHGTMNTGHHSSSNPETESMQNTGVVLL